jgi:hypothetical protein
MGKTDRFYVLKRPRSNTATPQHRILKPPKLPARFFVLRCRGVARRREAMGDEINEDEQGHTYDGTDAERHIPAQARVDE